MGSGFSHPVMEESMEEEMEADLLHDGPFEGL